MAVRIDEVKGSHSTSGVPGSTSVPSVDQQVRPVGDRVALLLALPLVEDHELAGPRNGDGLAVLVLHRSHVEELDLAEVVGHVA